MLETCMAAYAKTKGKDLEDTMMSLTSYHPSVTSKMAWQSWLKLHRKWRAVICIPVGPILSCHIPSAGLTSTEAVAQRQAVMEEIEQCYLEQPKQAKAWFE